MASHNCRKHSSECLAFNSLLSFESTLIKAPVPLSFCSNALAQLLMASVWAKQWWPDTQEFSFSQIRCVLHSPDVGGKTLVVMHYALHQAGKLGLSSDG